MERNFIALTAVVAALALATVMTYKQRSGDLIVPDEPVTSSLLSAEPASLGSPVKSARPAASIDDRRDDGLLSQVDHKHPFLFADIDQAHIDELKRRLLEREGSPDSKQRKRSDSSISELLPMQEFEHFRALKD